MRIALVVALGLGAIALVVSRTSTIRPLGDGPTAAVAESATTPIVEAPAMLGTAPEILKAVHEPLVEIDGWLQSDIESIEELRGNVVIVEFWTFGCYNCKNRIPYTREIYATYHDQGLEIVGIHSPEFDYEKDVGNIETAMADLGVIWPVALDTRRRTFRQWQSSPAYWPRTYVLDQDGQVRFDHIGEGGYEALEQTVAYLLAEGP